MRRNATIAVLLAAIFVASGPAVAFAGLCADAVGTTADTCCVPANCVGCDESVVNSFAVPSCCVTEAPPAVPPVPVTQAQASVPTPVYIVLDSAAYAVSVAKASEVVPSRQVSTPADLSSSTVLRC